MRFVYHIVGKINRKDTRKGSGPYKVTVAGAPCHKSCCTLVMFCVKQRLQVPPLRAVDETSSIQKMQIGSCSSTSVHHGIRCCTYTSHMGSGLEMVQVQVEAR